MKRTMMVSLLMSFVVMFLCLEAGAEQFDVTSTQDRVDTNPGDGNCIAQGTIGPRCTLRAAIMEANSLPGGPHWISVPTGIYTLSIEGANEQYGFTGDLDIWNSITISGAGVDKTIIDGGGIDRVFDFHSGTSTINGVTIRNGSTTGAGGGVLVTSGIVTIQNSFVTGNSAQLGAGILNAWDLTVRHCTISGNHATGGGGGGISNHATLELDTVTISGNSAVTGGGLSNTDLGVAALTSVTIAENSSAGGVGIDNASGTVKLTHTIIAHSLPSNCAGVITSQGHNLEGGGNSCGLDASGDLPFIPLGSVGLLPLANNGGAAKTHALSPTSVAIDAGGITWNGYDQRGVRRPQDGDGDRTSEWDIGAYEFRKSKIGVFRNGQWALDYSGNGVWNPPPTDLLFSFGVSADVPVISATGDWGNMLCPLLGEVQMAMAVFRSGTWYLDATGNGQWDGAINCDRVISFGLPADKPVAGDWNGDRSAKVGVFRAGKWYLDGNSGTWDGCGAFEARCYTFGLATDVPVVGDWNGDGKTKIGVFRNGTWVLDFNGNGKWDGAPLDKLFTFGLATDKPVTGDWNGDGKTEIGVFRGGTWVLDMNGNGKWDGAPLDKVFTFGLATDKPVTGNW